VNKLEGDEVSANTIIGTTSGTTRLGETSSSAVAEKPRDALYPSVDSLNKIITRANSFIIVT